jgi:hypothetical protein
MLHPICFGQNLTIFRGLLSVLVMATKNVAGKWLAFTSGMWLYFCYMLFPTLIVARSVLYRVQHRTSYAKGRGQLVTEIQPHAGSED